MSLVVSLAVGNGDMFYVRHDNANFTIIDCCIDPEERARIVPHIQSMIRPDDIVRFISTHPDQDHLRGLAYLDDIIQIPNFYCVRNRATKDTRQRIFSGTASCDTVPARSTSMPAVSDAG